MPTQQFTGTLSVLSCADCSVVFGITTEMEREARTRGTRFYCPNGHPLHFPGKTDRQKLQEAKDEADYWARRHKATRELLEAEERSHTATRGHVTRKKKELARVRSGVCPVEGCRRHFTNLDRHMQSKHPEFKP